MEFFDVIVMSDSANVTLMSDLSNFIKLNEALMNLLKIHNFGYFNIGTQSQGNFKFPDKTYQNNDIISYNTKNINRSITRYQSKFETRNRNSRLSSTAYGD